MAQRALPGGWHVPGRWRQSVRRGARSQSGELPAADAPRRYTWADTYAWQPPSDEWNASSLNYTSGTTGNPKGVTLINADPALRAGIERPITAMIAGAAPPRATIEGMEQMGVAIAHVYGLTETYGPSTICAVQEDWSALDVGGRAERLGRQGVRFLAEEGLTVTSTGKIQKYVLRERVRSASAIE